ncbi:MAG: MFS transporter [Cyanobacteria bacterium SZAS LIN-3]|nr:MFS transporter [Cyanobacteria bacterium SZAS LIN-3]
MHLPGGRLKALKPAIFVPTLYFLEGLPYALVVMASVIFYKNLGQSLEFIGQVTSGFYLPWVLKFAWAPMVDLFGTKRGWVISAQVVFSVVCLVFALTVGTLPKDTVIQITVAGFWLMAFVSATQDVSIDGYYLEALTNKEEQSYFVGIRSAAYKMAILFGSGLLVYMIGVLQTSRGLPVAAGWAIAFGICSAIALAAAVFHFFALPKTAPAAKPEGDESEVAGASLKGFLIIFRTFFEQEKILWIVIYILIFRLGDAFVLKMANPFLMDLPAKGGLALGNDVVGLISSIGIVALLLGGLLGGFVVSKYGLKRTLMPTAIFQNLSILSYLFLAQYRPGPVVVGVFNSIEQFGYGLGTAAYTVFLMSTVKNKYKGGHYAIATAFMAFGILLPGYFSGNLAAMLGYKTFFLVSFLAAIPGMMTILLLPLEDK